VTISHEDLAVSTDVIIHPTAIVHENAQLGVGVKIGPYCVVGEDVTINDHTHCHSHVNIQGGASVGKSCKLFPFSSIGTVPQDLKYQGEKTRLIIGDHNTIREHVTMNIGTAGDNGITQVGSHCLFMVGCHVAHDCVIGDHVVMANNATLAGHVQVASQSIIGGMSAVHQFVRIGKQVMVAGASVIVHDIPPFALAKGNRASLVNINRVGLRRSGYATRDINHLSQTYNALFGGDSDGVLSERIARCRLESSSNQLTQELLNFLEQPSKRGYTKSAM
jgi:UDP-N-acetylglucosamine acyltransferase